MNEPDEAAARADRAQSLAQRLRAGDRRALAEAITEVENGSESGAEIRQMLHVGNRAATVIGFTGPPGAGKSTLIGAVADRLVACGHRLGALLVDPSSPVTGGAVLADRVRMKQRSRNDALYVRSIGARGQRGGLARPIHDLVSLLEAWGADVILVETVGAGQGEVDICALADHTIAVCPPGLGDELQAMKAGLLELADIFVVNKADRPGAMATAGNLSDIAHGTSGFRPVLTTIATTGEGVDALVAEIERRIATGRVDHPGVSSRTDSVRRALAARAAAWTEEQIMTTDDAEIEELITALQSHTIDLDTAGARAATRVTQR